MRRILLPLAMIVLIASAEAQKQPAPTRAEEGDIACGTQHYIVPELCLQVFLISLVDYNLQQLLWDTLIYSEWVATLDGHMKCRSSPNADQYGGESNGI